MKTRALNMMSIKKSIINVAILVVLLTSCRNSIIILENQDFNHGDWLLVNIDHNKGIMNIIDDENILKTNPNGIKVKFFERDMYTTCDGEIKLFKDGILIVDHEYLTPSQLTLSNVIKNAFKKGTDSMISPTNKQDFQVKWDSLKNISQCYPTLFHEQPEDKDIIRFYKYE